MKNLIDIKNQYAQEQGYEDWDDLSEETNYADDYELHWTEICIRAQKAALEKAAENAECYEFERGSIDTETITNEENLIR